MLFLGQSIQKSTDCRAGSEVCDIALTSGYLEGERQFRATPNLEVSTFCA